MFRDAVNPSLDAAGNASLRSTPRHMTSRAHLVSSRDALGQPMVRTAEPP
jgi:hypothetical protein